MGAQNFPGNNYTEERNKIQDQAAKSNYFQANKLPGASTKLLKEMQ